MNLSHLPRLLLSLIVGSLLLGGTATAAPYFVHPGDVLLVSVWKEDGLEQEVLVRPDGGLSFPLVGDISATGKTVNDLQQEITAKIEEYIPDPVVTVSLRQVLGNKIYVIGKVNAPGQFIVNPNVDVMQALSMAGGMNPFAQTSEIRVLRRVDGEQKSIPFNYNEIESGENLGQNIVLKSGDVVVVP